MWVHKRRVNCEAKEEFIRKFKKATEKRYDFFYVDQQTKIKELMYIGVVSIKIISKLL